MCDAVPMENYRPRIRAIAVSTVLLALMGCQNLKALPERTWLLANEVTDALVDLREDFGS